MGTQIGSRLITDGLIIYLDAANPKSYPGTGEIWYDLMGNTNGTFVNGTSYSSQNGGVIVTDGINDSVAINKDMRNQPFTIMATSRYVSTPGGRIVAALNGTNNFLLGHWGNTTQNYFAQGWVTSAGSGPSDTNWRIYAGTGDVANDSWSFYLNGNLNAGPNNLGANGPWGICLGANRATLEFSNAQIGNLLVYNRVLTEFEIKQNYNVFRERYGI